MWLVGYTYGRKTYQIVADEYTGQNTGERPIMLTVVAEMVMMGW